MVAALRSYFSAGLAITTAGLVAIAPVPPRVPAPDTAVTHPAPHLTAGESLLNVPLNLFQDLVNVPANYIHALDTTAKSLFYSGPW
ncbi:MAG: hypothetical protein M3Y90_07195, partial [Actinomycetota bacterium]|nr:hypothetical protein [Actinomycetota bacterium]